MASKRKAEDQLDEYNMKHKRRGSALIFNHQNYELSNSKNLGERLGTAKDRKVLTTSFEKLGFKVAPYDDLKKEEIMGKLQTAAEEDHTDADCFLCVFLSHGDEDGHVFANDDKIKIKDVTNLFRGDKCKSLVGKPKIFIFQACRGKVSDNAVTGMSAGDEEEEEVAEEAAMIYTLPAGADFIMCYSVAQGFQAYRHIDKGSYYIQDLCETLQQQGSTLEFTELLTLINMKVSRHSFKEKKQIPCFTSMLTKKLYFTPKE